MNTESTQLHLEHPFTRGDFTIATPMLRRIYDEVVAASATRKWSITYIAPSQHGKSRICQAIKTLWLIEQKVPVFLIRKRSNDRDAANRRDPERAFWGNILSSFGYPNFIRLKPEARFEAILNSIRSACRINQQERAVILFDEGNEFDMTFLRFLADIGNELMNDNYGAPISLTTIFFGTEQLETIADLVRNEQEQPYCPGFLWTADICREYATKTT